MTPERKKGLRSVLLGAGPFTVDHVSGYCVDLTVAELLSLMEEHDAAISQAVEAARAEIDCGGQCHIHAALDGLCRKCMLRQAKAYIGGAIQRIEGLERAVNATRAEERARLTLAMDEITDMEIPLECPSGEVEPGVGRLLCNTTARVKERAWQIVNDARHSTDTPCPGKDGDR